MATLPLEGVRVVDLTVVWAGPFGTMLLADLGAEVIRVENINVWQTYTRGLMARPPKQVAAQYLPWTLGFPDREPGRRPWNRAPLFNAHARNKRSCTIDLRQPKGKELFAKLVSISDVVYENNPPETMEKLGITYDYLRSIKPDIIYVQVPGYGATGPYRNYRALGVHLEGSIGHTLLRTYPDLDPSQTSAVYTGDYLAGAAGAFATLVAIHHRRRTGKGQHIDLAQAENAIAMLAQAYMDYALNGRIQSSLGNRHPTAVQGCYPCKEEGRDRWVVITIRDDRDWEAFCRALGNPPWTQDPKFADVTSRRRHQDELDQHIAAWTSQHTNYEVMHILQAHGVPAGAVMDAKDCYEDPHLRERGFFHELYQEDCGTHLYPGFLWRYSHTPMRIWRAPVRLGEDNEYVYKELLGVSDEEYRRLEAEGFLGMDYAPEVP